MDQRGLIISSWIIVCLVVLMFVVGCGVLTDEEEEEIIEEIAPILEPISLMLDWYPNAIHAFLYTAMHKGFFADEGLELQMRFPTNPNDGVAMPAINDCDIGIYYLQDTIMAAIEERLPISSIGAIIQGDLHVVVSLAESKIKSPADFKGKRIGYASTPVAEAMIISMAEQAGVEVNDIEFVDVGFDLMNALTTKKVDATIGNMVNHEVPQLEEHTFNINYFYPVEYGIPNQHELIFVASMDLLESSYGKVVGFLRACRRGFDYTKENTAEAIDILMENQDERNFPLTRSVEEANLEVIIPSMELVKDTFLMQEDDIWQNNADWLFNKGLLSREINAPGLVSAVPVVVYVDPVKLPEPGEEIPPEEETPEMKIMRRKAQLAAQEDIKNGTVPDFLKEGGSESKSKSSSAKGKGKGKKGKKK
ncbi:MAG: ABC transporter substrate-binding protein [Bacillota bacterium]